MLVAAYYSCTIYLVYQLALHNFNRLSLKLHGNDLTLFINCKNVSTARVSRSPGGLIFDMVSTLFVGQGGPVFSGHFVVRAVFKYKLYVKSFNLVLDY